MSCNVPVGQPVKLILASEDVIHSFYLPAFRLKHDVVPGSYQTYWFQATKPGRYHIFCAEYAARIIPQMTGWVTVMEPAAYATWLAGGTGGVDGRTGREAVRTIRLLILPSARTQGRCPTLRYVYGHPVLLDDGRTVLADEAYVRESILKPNAKIVKGYHRDVMPVFEGQIGEDGLMQLVAFVKACRHLALLQTRA